jgi:hypothetical protein
MNIFDHVTENVVHQRTCPPFTDRVGKDAELWHGLFLIRITFRLFSKRKPITQPPYVLL